VRLRCSNISILVQHLDLRTLPKQPSINLSPCVRVSYGLLPPLVQTHTASPALCLVYANVATRKEELNMPVFTAQQNMAWPQLHEDSIPELAFWRALAKLMAVCGVNDFARDDLARPDPKRLRKQLSGLINFAKVNSSAKTRLRVPVIELPFSNYRRNYETVET